MVVRSLVATCFLCLPLAGPIATDAFAETGIASVYGYNGGKTASGERANPHQLTAAHKNLPFGTMVQVTNKKNGRTVMVAVLPDRPAPGQPALVEWLAATPLIPRFSISITHGLLVSRVPNNGNLG